MLVVITHVNNRMLTNLSDIPPAMRGPITYAWGFMTGFGSQAVIVFFVISGFLVGGKILTQIRDGHSIELRKYAVDRVARIYVVLIPTIFIVGILDFAGQHFFNSTQVYNHYDLPKHQTALVFWGTVVNLQGIFTNFWGTNGPLATLANEFWYYIAFPMLVAPWMKTRNFWSRMGLAISGVTILILWSYQNYWFGLGLVYWLVGAFARIAKRPWIPCSPLVSALLLLSYLGGTRIFVRASEDTLMLFISGFVVCVLFANLLITLLYSSKAPSILLSSSWHNGLADFSYSLYAIHASLLTFLCASLEYFTGFGWKEIPQKSWHWAYVLLILFATYLIAKIFSLFTEKKTKFFRDFGYKLLNVARKPSIHSSIH
jgi:peptidoglycan/LPS O-acetylase OafA/YrhL